LKKKNRQTEAEETERRHERQKSPKKPKIELTHRFFLKPEDLTDARGAASKDMRELPPDLVKLAKQKHVGYSNRLNPQQMASIRRMMELRRYSQVMYCNKEVF